MELGEGTLACILGDFLSILGLDNGGYGQITETEIYFWRNVLVVDSGYT